MASAGEWVRQIVAKSPEKPMTTEEVLKCLERHVGQGEKALQRVQDVSDYIDQQLVERCGGLLMRELGTTVADYQQAVLESRAAA